MHEISDFQTQRNRLPIQVTSLRAQCGPQGIFKAHALRIRTATKRRRTLGILPRRHLRAWIDTRRNKKGYVTNNPTSAKIGIPHQLGKERTSTKKKSGIPRIPLQHQGDANISTSGKIEQTVLEDKPIEETRQQQDMSMDSKLTWENDLDDTSYLGSSPTCSISSAGPLEEPLETLTRLGSQMSTISEGYRGPHMVGDLGEAGEQGF
ncbi:hypothetical protein DFQ28_007775 [Apophysomyces sp. BC1034]|nr:hypothetical protein DFQ28_007775 [Apophysomyces sp. BC1034]